MSDERDIERLKARVAELEDELAEQASRHQAMIAAAQEQTYWLDRWGLDLNALMRRPAVMRAYRLAATARRMVGKLR